MPASASAPTDTRISPSIDPEVFKNIEGYTDETRQFLDGVVSAVNDIYQTLGKLHDARRKADANLAWTPEMRIIKVGEEAEKHRSRVLARLANAERQLRTNIEHTEGLLSAPLTERAGVGTLNDAVREHVKALNRAEREAFMRSAFNEDDGLTLEALLGAPYYLSGFTKLDHEHYVRTYHQRRKPHLVHRLDAMNRFLAMVERVQPIIHEQFAKAVGAPAQKVRVFTELNDQALAALKIEPTA